MSSYFDVLNAVKEYYGSGSDQWVEIAKYGVRPDNIDIINQVPGVNVYTYLDGSIANVTYDKTLSTATETLAGNIDSNVALPTLASENTFNAPIPVTSSIEQSTGNYAMQSGSKVASTGAKLGTVARALSLGITAVTAGCRLGKFFAQKTYESNPDFWDSQLPSMNPETWKSIAGENEIGQKVMQFLFGVDPETNETTAYMDENAFAYMAYAMKKLGMFEQGDTQYNYDTTTISEWPNYVPVPVKSQLKGLGTYETGFVEYEILSLDSGWIPVICCPYSSKSSITALLFHIGDVQAPSVQYRYRASFTGWNDYSGANSRYVDTTCEGTTYTCCFLLFASFGGVTTFTSIDFYEGIVHDGVKYIATAIFDGTKSESSNVQGVTNQPDYTAPDTSTWTDPESTKQSLKQQYPSYWDNSVYNDVPQNDGTLKRHTYIPMPTIATTSANEKNPTNETVTKDQIAVNPNSENKGLLNTITRYITNTASQTPTDTPIISGNTNPPDTGSGDTPSIILPNGTASSLWSIYNPTQSELNSFGSWLWSSNFVEQLKKLFNDPMQAIIGIHKVFVEPPISGRKNIVCGYIDSNISANAVSGQYTTVDCGTVSLPEYFGNVFDYSPHTEVKLFLPFIGIVPLDTSYVMRSKIHIKYHVDIITGACLAEISIIRDNSGGVIYTYGGSCIVQYPISSGSYMGVVSGAISALTSAVGVGMSVASGNPLGALMGASGIASGIGSMRTNVQHSGGFTGSSGAMGGKKPYLIISRPQTQMTGHEGHMLGNPNNVYKKLSSYSGFVICRAVHVENISNATDTEKIQIENSLKSGVLVN